MASIEERLDKMEAKIKEPKFRDTTGKANEVNYWVFDYAPEHELIVRDRIEYLKNKNSRGTDGFELVVYDLYDLLIAHLQDKNFMEKCYQMEEKRGIVKVASAIQRSLKITDKDDCGIYCRAYIGKFRSVSDRSGKMLSVATITGGIQQNSLQYATAFCKGAYGAVLSGNLYRTGTHHIQRSSRR